jgi:heptosyltransferase-2/heptosyltransferase-3
LAGGLIPTAPPAAATPRRILLIRPDHIGDVLLTSPAVAHLRQTLPAAEITYLVGPWSVDVARRGPAVDRIETLRFPGFTRQPKRNALEPYLLLFRAGRQLRTRRYDRAYVFRPDHWWGALLALVAGIPRRIGFDTPETRPLLSQALPLVHGEHAVQQALRLVGSRCQGQASVFRLEPADHAWAEQQVGFEHRPVVVVQPSAGAALKSWPIERWARVADGLNAAGRAVVLCGGPADASLLQAICGTMRSRPAAILHGQSVAESAAVYARSTVLIGLDGGAAHLAAAVGTPTVRLYGPADPDVFGPWPASASQRVLITHALACVPCGHLVAPPCAAATLPACLLALGPDDVLEAALEIAR